MGVKLCIVVGFIILYILLKRTSKSLVRAGVLCSIILSIVMSGVYVNIKAKERDERSAKLSELSELITSSSDFRPTFEYGEIAVLSYPSELSPISDKELAVDTSELGTYTS